ncbi:cyclic diguanylate phosphodiesterase [Enterobacter cloacae]|uniref:EAL domain-containing protein n=1 Tax=Enterobacter cloacae complex TaxID=354276 RepID=UPI002108B2A4|nr:MULTISPECIES: cyclic diguanylate phosphodiesterase [Enterobacter cloacae complex]MCQ4445285.1 cyclic diguanylate phosphodiesterase [Enterobacter cloacae]MDW2869681.1 EAL domain-containing protein [Enterobacter hormaechei]
MKKIIAVAIISTLLVVLSLYAVNAVIVNQQKSKQLEISHTLLQYSEDLSQSVAQALKSITTQGCDKTSLDSYRQIKLDSLYFGDIGFIEKGKIVCTAFWGKLATPVELPAELHKTPRGFLLAQFDNKDFFTGNAAIYHNIIIFTSRYAYDKFTPVTASYSLSATTKDFGRTFFSATPAFKQQDWLHATLFTITLTQCSAFWDLCVIVKHHNAGLASLPPVMCTLLVAILYFIWIAITLFFFRIYEDRFSLERTLVKAVITNTITVKYQPIIRIQDQKIVGVEVLSRWRDQKHGDVSPELFIPLIKKIGLYKKYYTNILEKALSEIAPLAIKHQLVVSLNVGRKEIEDGQFINVLRRACLIHNIPLTLIKVELSEKAVSIENILEEFCRKLKSLGIKVSIDDFGVQNSNLARLSLLEYDEIKIDKSLVDGISEHYKQNIFVIFSDALARLNKTLVFEGVENEIQYRFIADRYPGALIQGWYFSKSLTRSELAKILVGVAR